MELYKVFIFNSDERHRFLTALLGWMSMESRMQFAVMISYDRGPHIEIAVESTVAPLESFIAERLAALRLVPDYSVNYEEQRKLVARVALLEGRPEAAADLADDLSSEQRSGAVDRVMFPSNFVEDYRNLTGFLYAFLPYYSSVDPSARSLLLLKLMMIFPEPRWGEPGVYSAYYSFASHLHGFGANMARLPWGGDQLERIQTRLRSRSTAEEAFIHEGFGSFLACLDSDFEGVDSEAERRIFLEFRQAATATREEYGRLFDGGGIGLTESDGVSSYLTLTPELSEFHVQVKATIDPRFFESREFIVGRMMMNWFYGMLPYLLVSPIEKQRLCRLLVDAVEKHRGADAAELLDRLVARAATIGKAPADGI